MKDNVFLKKVKEFAEYNNHSYDIEKYSLKESYAESFLVDANIGGSSGGDCWGGRSSEYEKDTEDIISDLSGSLEYKIMQFFSDYVMVVPKDTIKEHLHNISRYDYIGKNSDGVDYYGNYSEYAIYEIPMYPLMKKMLDDEHFQIFKSYFSNEKKKIISSFENTKKEKEIKELTVKIENFEAKKNKEKENIKNDIKKYEEILNHLKNQEKHFEKNKKNELSKLKYELKKLSE